MARSLNTTGAAYHQLGNMQEAEVHYLRAFEMQSQNGDPAVGTTLQNLVNLYGAMGKKEEATYYGRLKKEQR